MGHSQQSWAFAPCSFDMLPQRSFETVPLIIMGMRRANPAMRVTCMRGMATWIPQLVNWMPASSYGESGLAALATTVSKSNLLPNYSSFI